KKVLQGNDEARHGNARPLSDCGRKSRSLSVGYAEALGSCETVSVNFVGSGMTRCVSASDYMNWLGCVDDSVVVR
ncbi:MAG: hypothetical protein VYA84_07965, partial [Planctomycetota bacterium]|nr:hypothetical protein [Planctomycetota bacterium]